MRSPAISAAISHNLLRAAGSLASLACAKARGAKFTISTDAHHPKHLGNMGYGIRMARRGWLEPGDVIHVGPDDWHFHGGGPETPLVHVAVNGAGTPEWGEPVTDAEYDEGF